MKVALALAAGVSAISCSGCGAVKSVVNDPSSITLDQAVAQAVDAFYVARDRSEAHHTQPIGLNACSMQATFAVTAGANDHQGLVLNVGAPAGSPVNAGATGTFEQMSSAQRQNTITLLFTTPACNPPNTLGSTKPEDVSLLQQQIGAARQNLYMPPPRMAASVGGSLKPARQPGASPTQATTGGATPGTPASGGSAVVPAAGASAGPPEAPPRRFPGGPLPTYRGLPGANPDVILVQPSALPHRLLEDTSPPSGNQQEQGGPQK